MKINKLLIVLLFGTLLFLPGCELIVDIFAAGVLFGIILVVIVIGLIIWGISKLFG